METCPIEEVVSRIVVGLKPEIHALNCSRTDVCTAGCPSLSMQNIARL